MPNRNYQNGANFERKVKKELEEQGWWVARTAGSHSIVDLICIKRGNKPLMLQCKLNGVISAKDREELKRWAKSVDVCAGLVHRIRVGRKYETQIEPV